MTGIIFAAGIGSRLKPFTDSHPKALAPLGGVPMAVRVATKLLAAGADALIVNVHHFADQVEACLRAQPFADAVSFSDERSLLLDTGGALSRIAAEHPQLMMGTEPVIVHNADIYTDFPISEMLASHVSSGADVTLLVDPARPSTRNFLFDTHARLHGWTNDTTGAVKPADLDTAGLRRAAFGGVHIISPRALKLIGEAGCGKPFSVTDWYLQHCTDLDIRAYTPSQPYRWHDIGTPEKLAAAEADIR